MVYVLVALLVFGEAALFVGFVLPGETTVLVAGVIASQGRINVVALATLVVITAALGDSVGYFIGREYGHRILEWRVMQRHNEEIEQSLERLKARGPFYVFVGRFTAFLRAVMPGLAGLSRMKYSHFFFANASSALVWGVSCSTLGYLAGTQLALVERYFGYFSSGLLVIFVTIVVRHFLRRRKRQSAQGAQES